MYVSMGVLLDKANRENYGVMAINCFNLESAFATIHAAEEMNSPIIIDLLMEHLKKHLGLKVVLPAVIGLAREAKVQVAINLDHGKSEDYVKEAINAGFSSVMIDASEKSFEENVKETQKMIRFAKRKEVSVEAEVGGMGAVANENFTNTDMYTNPEEAIEFIKATDVTALAISFGSSHGIMPKGYIPKFDFEIVKKIKKATSKPLVLHGGSGCGADNIRKAVECGINKVNVGSDVMKAQLDALYKQIQENRNKDFVEMVEGTIEPAKEMVKYYINIVGSRNKDILSQTV
ncbi:class II fructose-bisphosphate aldolase [Sporolactobacillus sp. CQH2019]|uniref:class II fructose-bisphosphate aldolase n=1 Tax=Sporolactobacillus sp. CQH2019 TaxID=3023512 RepID=UPI002368B050|nr:class II fructose-bisphosphate aldolase [Sporolactobacillus sp. CQH2019]MDD9147474.1 class II fructose-bisphosphate aldolase [Sporolactobacillus sp. CQH2019]